MKKIYKHAKKRLSDTLLQVHAMRHDFKIFKHESHSCGGTGGLAVPTSQWMNRFYTKCFIRGEVC